MMERRVVDYGHSHIPAAPSAPPPAPADGHKKVYDYGHGGANSGESWFLFLVFF